MLSAPRLIGRRQLIHRGFCSRIGSASQESCGAARNSGKLPCQVASGKKLQWFSAEWRTRMQEALERRGDVLVTCANVLQLCGFACYDALYLQSIMILGNGSMALFFITRMPPLGVACFWALLKVAVNIFMVCTIVMKRQPVKLTPEELLSYEEHFMPYGVTARQFKTFWDLGEQRQTSEDEFLTVEGKPVDHLTLVIDGYVYRKRGGRHVPHMDAFPGSSKGHSSEDGGSWCGEMSMLRMIDDVSQRSTVADTPNSDERKKQSEEREKVQELQRTLTSFGFYDGAIDGETGERTAHALRKFHEAWGVKGNAADVSKMLGIQHKMIDRLWNPNTAGDAMWTTQTSEGTVIRCWRVSDLLNLSRSNAEMRGAMRKAFSQSVIKKVIAMEADKVPLESLGGSAGQEALQRYEHALRIALSDGKALPEDKAALSGFRRKHDISEAQHESSLQKAVGWTPREYSHGALFSHMGDSRRSRAALALADSVDCSST